MERRRGSWVYEGPNTKQKDLPDIFADPNMSENDIDLRKGSLKRLNGIMDAIAKIKLEYDFINEHMDLSDCQKTEFEQKIDECISVGRKFEEFIIEMEQEWEFTDDNKEKVIGLINLYNQIVEKYNIYKEQHPRWHEDYEDHIENPPSLMETLKRKCTNDNNATTAKKNRKRYEINKIKIKF